MSDTHKTEHLRGNHHHKGQAGLGNLDELRRELRDELGQSGAKIKEGLEETKDILGSKATKLKKHMRAQGSELHHRVDNYVQEKPLTALGMAALAGLIFGWMMRK